MQAAGDAGMERAVVRREPSDEFGQLRAHHRLAVVRFGGCPDRTDRALALVKLPLRDAVKPGEERVAGW
jgi:hypothetical protein